MEQELWEFDIDVVRRGSFSIMAKSLEEAQAMVDAMDEDEIRDRATWFCTEGEVSY